MFSFLLVQTTHLLRGVSVARLLESNYKQLSHGIKGDEQKREGAWRVSGVGPRNSFFQPEMCGSALKIDEAMHRQSLGRRTQGSTKTNKKKKNLLGERVQKFQEGTLNSELLFFGLGEKQREV